MDFAYRQVKSRSETMDRFRPSSSPCPVGRASRLLGDRWVLLIVREAFLGATRFEEFLPNTGINRAALTTRLAVLVEYGVLERDPPTGRRAEYQLTDAGKALLPLIETLREWGDTYLPPAARENSAAN